MELSIGKRFTVDLTTEEVGLVMELIDGFDDVDMPPIRSQYRAPNQFPIGPKPEEIK